VRTDEAELGTARGVRLGSSKYSWATEYWGMDSQTNALLSNTSWLHPLHTKAHVLADFMRCSRTRRDLHAASRSRGSRSFREPQIARIALFEDGAGRFAKTTPERDSSTLTRCSPQRRGCHTRRCGRRRCMTDATRWSWSERSLLFVTCSVGYRGAQCTIVARSMVERRTLKRCGGRSERDDER
jgi:hypothetical protein